MKKVLYPGSFNPITKGHMNVISQATELFDEVVIAVMKNSNKPEQFFSIEERIELIRNLYKDSPNISVVTGEGATVKIAMLNECKAIIRGLRGVTDFDYEIQLSAINRKLSNNQVNTICLFPDTKYQYISSSVVREVFSLGEDISDYVDPVVEKAIQKKYVR